MDHIDNLVEEQAEGSDSVIDFGEVLERARSLAYLSATCKLLREIHKPEPLRVKLLGLLVVSDDEMRVVMSYRQEMLHDPILGTSRRRQTVHEAERFMSYVLRQRAKTLWKIHDPISYRACGELPRNIGGYGSRRLCVWHMNRVRRDAMMSFYTRLAIASKLAQIKEAAPLCSKLKEYGYGSALWRSLVADISAGVLSAALNAAQAHSIMEKIVTYDKRTGLSVEVSSRGIAERASLPPYLPPPYWPAAPEVE